MRSSANRAVARFFVYTPQPAHRAGRVALAFRDDALEAALADGGEQRLPEGRVLFVTPERRSPHDPAIEASGTKFSTEMIESRRNHRAIS